MSDYHYKYTVREFKVPLNGEHECGGDVVAVLQKSFNIQRQEWYLTVLVRHIKPGRPDAEANV